MEKQQIEEIFKLLQSVYLPINYGDVTIGATRLKDTDTFKLASALHDAGYIKLIESKWLPYSNERTSGWLCGNCKKYSTGKKHYCSFCGAKMDMED